MCYQIVKKNFDLFFLSLYIYVSTDVKVFSIFMFDFIRVDQYKKNDI